MRSKHPYDEIERSVFKRLHITSDSEAFARSVINREIDAYLNIKINKGGSGRTRQISAPMIELANIQRTILRALEEIVSSAPKGRPLIHSAAHAYRKYRSHTSAAKVHLGMKWGVKVDIQKFYDHITEQHVYRALLRAGLKDEAYFWTKLCTRLPYNWPEGLPVKYRRLQRALSRPEPNYLYDSRDRWFAQLLPTQILAGRIKKKTAQLAQSNGTIYRILPPKRILRIFFWGRRVSVPDLKNLEVQLLFERVKKVFGLDLDKKEKRAFEQQIRFSRKRWRKRIIEMYEDRVAFGYAYGDERQKHYPVRPEQYRMRRKIGFLPQGSPASGLISNLVMKPFDGVIMEFCKENGLSYTRYSDDIVISSKKNDFSRDRALTIISFIQKLAESNGFSLNREKTRIMTPGSRKYVLGVLVDGKELRLGKHERERIKRMIYQIAKFGDFWSDKQPALHLLNASRSLPGKRLGAYNSPHTPSEPLESLLGWLSYCKTADLEFLKKTHASLEKGKWHFKESTHLDAILSHTSQLLNFKTRDGNLEQNPWAGPHWRPPLTKTSEDESGTEESPR